MEVGKNDKEAADAFLADNLSHSLDGNNQRIQGKNRGIDIGFSSCQ